MNVKTANPLSQAAAREAAEKEEANKKRAARQAVKGQVAPEQPAAVVEVRVLKRGDSKISMGHHAAGIGEAHYEAGEQFKIEEPIARALEARDYVEIMGAKA